MKNRPFIHTLVYGESGSGKSTFAASFPTPQLILFFDPFTKDLAFMRNLPTSGVMPGNVPWQEVYSQDGDTIRRIEYFLDANPQSPTGYQYFIARFAEVHRGIQQARAGDIDAQKQFPYQTVIIDSLTMAELGARKLSEYKLNPTTKEPRQWFGYSTNALEEMLMIRCGSLPCNVVAICHLDKEKDEVEGLQVRNPNLPGRLRGNAASAFGEFYHAYRRRNDKGEFTYLLQTRGDQFFNANSMIQAPNPAVPDYNNLWGNW